MSSVTVVCVDSGERHEVTLTEASLDAFGVAVAGATGWAAGTYEVLLLSGGTVASDADIKYGAAYCIKKADTAADGAAFFDLPVDITPDVELLIKGGDDYDLVTALAELLDNSLQSTIHPSTSRLISIDFCAAQNSLTLFDNGKGMSVDGLKNWAILGRQTTANDATAPTPPLVQGDNTTNTNTNTPAVRGERRPPIIKTVPDQSGDASFECHSRVVDFLTSDFSRYGVGSKKAVFSIGDTVEVSTKRADTPWVSQCTLSKSSMRKDGWCTVVKARHPTAEEAAHTSFTTFRISDIKQVHTECYSTAYLKAWLAHIYHYYIFGPAGNVAAPQPAPEEGELEGTTLSLGARLVDFVVDGESIKGTAQNNDAESLLLRNGVERVTFDIRLGLDQMRLHERTPVPTMRAAPSRSAPLSQEGVNGSDSSQPPVLTAVDPAEEAPTVKVALCYFPFKDGAETMPIPAGLTEAHGAAREYDRLNDEQLPLYDRKPGLEVFWNGRLLPREFLEYWPLLKPGASKKEAVLPAACFRRVKGQVFLDSAFTVTANKHTLSRETTQAKALAQYTSRTLHAAIKKWVSYCHRTHDEELIFGEVDKDKLRTDGTTHYKSVKVTNMYIEMGTYVIAKQPTGRGKLIGHVNAIFTNHRVYEAAHGCSIKMTVEYSSSATTSGDVVVPIGLVQRVLSQKEADEELKKTRKNHPTTLRVSLPDTYYAAASIDSKSFKVSMCTEDGKPLRRDASLEVQCIATSQTGAAPLITTVTCRSLARGANEYCVKLADFKEEGSSFLEFTGVYVFRFTSSLSTIHPLEHTVRVLPNCKDISKVSCSVAFSSDATEKINEVTIDKEMEALDILFTDPLGNAVSFDELAKKHTTGDPLAVSCKEEVLAVVPKVEDVKSTKKRKKGVEPVQKPFAFNCDQMRLKSTPTGVNVSGVVAEGTIASLKTASSTAVTLMLRIFSTIELAVPIVKLRAGPPVSLRVSALPAAVGWSEEFPASLFLIDKYENPTSSTDEQLPQMQCEASVEGNAKLLRQPLRADLSTTGTFQFTELGLARPPKQPVPSENVDVTLHFQCFYRIKDKRHTTSLAVSKDLSVKPPSSFAHMLLCNDPDWLAGKGKRTAAEASAFATPDYDTKVHSTPLDSAVQATVGAELSRLVAVVHNPPEWLTPGGAKVKCSWDEKRSAKCAIEEQVAVKEEGAPATGKQYTVLLPAVQGPAKEACLTHTIVIHKKGSEAEQILHKVTVNYAKGPPAHIVFVPDTLPATLSQNKAFALQCRVTDAHGNDLPVKHPLLQGMKLTLRQVDSTEPVKKKAKKEKEVKVRAKVDIVFDKVVLKSRDTTWALQGLRLKGKCGKLDLQVVSSELLGELQSEVVAVELEAGDPVAVTLDGTARPEDAPLQVECVNFSSINPMRVGLVDAAGNECSIDKRPISFESLGAVKLVKCPTLKKSKAGNLFDSRLGVFTPQLSAMAPLADSSVYPRSATTTLTLEDLPKNVNVAHISVALQPSRIPFSVRVGNLSDAAVPLSVRGDKHSQRDVVCVEAGKLAAEQVLKNVAAGLPADLLGEDGSAAEYIPTDRVSLQLTSPVLPSAVTLYGPPSSSQAPNGQADAAQVSFPDFLQYMPTHAGMYTARIELDLQQHRHKELLERAKCTRRKVDAFAFNVVPSEPRVVRGKVAKAQSSAASEGSDKKRRKKTAALNDSAWGASHHLGGVTEKMPLFDGLRIEVHDAHGNVCSNFTGTLTVNLLTYSDTEGARSSSLSQAPGNMPGLECEGCTADATHPLRYTVAVTEGEVALGQATLCHTEAAPEGSFCLHFTLEGKTADPLVLPFYCTDDSKKQKKLQKLTAQKWEFQRFVNHLEKKLGKFKARQREWDEVEGMQKKGLNFVKPPFLP